MRATYRRLQGTEVFLGFYDVHADCLSGLFRRRKRVLDISKAFCYLRRCYPRKRLFVILDNLHNVRDHPRFLALLRRLRIRPVWRGARGQATCVLIHRVDMYAHLCIY
jgi:hypothetical protein